MSIKNSISDQTIIQALDSFYGITAHTLTFLPLGADANASVYKADTDTQSYFIKLRKGQQNESTIMDFLQEAGISHIIAPIKTIDRKSIQHIEGFTLIVYPFITGENGFNQSLTQEQWQVLGEALKKLHQIKVPESFQKQLRYETYTDKFRKDVLSFYHSLDNCSPQDNVALAFIDDLKKDSEIIHKLVAHAEQLSLELKAISSPFVLCHADIHGGNVLIDKNGDIYIIDWDAPMMAPKERDLMFIGGGIANVWNTHKEEVLFYEGYGETEVNKDILAYYRNERIVEDIALFIEAILFTESDNETRLENYHHFKAMFEPRGVVEIALNTYENNRS